MVRILSETLAFHREIATPADLAEVRLGRGILGG